MASVMELAIKDDLVELVFERHLSHIKTIREESS